jgi:hypothetical protein
MAFSKSCRRLVAELLKPDFGFPTLKHHIAMPLHPQALIRIFKKYFCNIFGES